MFSILASTRSRVRYRSKILYPAVLLLISCISCSIFDSEDVLFDEEYFTSNFNKKSEYLIVIPDIQNYISESIYNKYFESVITWINLLCEFDYKVKAVLQVGDITNFNKTERMDHGPENI